MKKLINRLQINLIESYLKKFPVIAVMGARQVGKTTLVKELLKEERAFYTFDEPAVAQLAESNPLSFLTQAEKITIDEVQKVPTILTAIKRIVDEKRNPGQFIITGSANITLLPKISETLAGRIIFVDMFPLTIYEITSTIKDEPRAIKIFSSDTAERCWKLLNRIESKRIDLGKITFRGGFPVAWLEENDVARQDWFKGYVRTYLERDVRDLSRIQKLYDYQRFLSLTTFRCSQILSRSDLSRDSGVPYTTANHYFDLLLATYQVFLLQPYFRNIGKRLIKSPKLLWNDTGLALHLQGITHWADAERLGRSTFLIENKIILEVKTLLSAYMPLAKLYYWRTSGGAEIDMVIETNGNLIPIEVKWTEKVGPRDIVSMESFLKDFSDQVPFGIFLYRGKEILKLRERIFLVPFGRFLG